jgi:hypothetical protein
MNKGRTTQEAIDAMNMANPSLGLTFDQIHRAIRMRQIPKPAMFGISYFWTHADLVALAEHFNVTPPAEDETDD